MVVSNILIYPKIYRVHYLVSTLSTAYSVIAVNCSHVLLLTMFMLAAFRSLLPIYSNHLQRAAPSDLYSSTKTVYLAAD